MFDVHSLVHMVRNYQQDKLMDAVKDNPELGNDTNDDHNQLVLIMALHFILRIIRIIIYAVTLSYFLGMSWLIICKICLYESGINSD